MYPILISVGPIHIYSLSVFLILSWLVFSFLFWRSMRLAGVVEERIFDLMFAVTLMSLLFARLGFVTFTWQLFADDFLKIAAIWVTPGLSWSAGLVGGLLTLVFLARRYKLRLGLALDALAVSLPMAVMVGKIGSFLGGAEVGKIADLPWTVRYVGEIGRRHPIQLYEILALVLLTAVSVMFVKTSATRRRPYGIVGVGMFLFYSTLMFLLEFFKDSSVYWLTVNANQLVMIGLFAESLGVLYVRGGGREAIRPTINKTISGAVKFSRLLYAKISRRGHS